MSGQDLSSMRRSKLRFSDSFASLLFGGAVLIALFAFFYVERNRTGVAPERPASKEFLRAGLRRRSDGIDRDREEFYRSNHQRTGDAWSGPQ